MVKGPFGPSAASAKTVSFFKTFESEDRMKWLAWDTTKNREVCEPIPNGSFTEDVAKRYAEENPESNVVVGYVLDKPVEVANG